MFKRAVFVLLLGSCSIAMASTAEPHQTRALTRHQAKCQQLYSYCMNHNCKGKTADQCSMATHCRVEYLQYCMSESSAIAPKQASQAQSNAALQRQQYNAQQACRQQLKLDCQHNQPNKQCLPNAAYNTCMRAAQQIGQ